MLGWHCERVSAGCVNCYAERINQQRFGTGLPYNRVSRDRVEVVLDTRTLLLPLRWRKPRRIFVCSMTDLFGEWVPDAFIDRVFAVASLCPQHTFLVLTKRTERMRAYLTNDDRMYVLRSSIEEWCTEDTPGPLPWPIPNVWLGASVEDQAAADRRIPELLATPAAVRFLSCEPLLEEVFIEDFEFCGAGYGVFPGGDPRLFDPDEEVCTVAEVENWKAACVEWDRGAGVDRGPGCATMGDGSVWTGGGFGLGGYTRRSGLHWVVVGGESGPGRRPCEVEWIADIVRQCDQAEVPVFVKQDSGPRPGMQGRIPADLWARKEVWR